MKNVLRLSFASLICFVIAGRTPSQDLSLRPTYGAARLNAGFWPDPFTKQLEAGGPIETRRGGVRAWVANEPDFQLFYTAGRFPLIFHVESKEDTTLLINLPDGTWVANDDGPNTGLNPLLRFSKPQSGRYDIWVGTYEKGKIPPAKLIITELPIAAAAAPPIPAGPLPTRSLPAAPAPAGPLPGLGSRAAPASIRTLPRIADVPPATPQLILPKD